MIFIKDKIYAKCWSVKKDEKFIDLRVTTSEKDQKEEGKYLHSTWFPRLIGHAFNSLKDTIKDGDKIVITKAKLTNLPYTTKDGETRSSFKFLVLEAELDEPANAQSSQTEEKSEEKAESSASDSEDCPW